MSVSRVPSFFPATAIAAGSLMLLSPSPLPGGVLLGGSLLSLLRPTASVDTIGQTILSLLVGALGYVFYFVVFDAAVYETTDKLGPLPASIAFCLIGMAALRNRFTTPVFGNVATGAVLSAAVLFLGAGRIDTTMFTGVVTIMTLALLGGVRREQRWWPTLKQQTPFLHGASAMAIGLAMVLFGLFSTGLPYLYHRALDRYFDATWERHTGFSGTLKLEAMNGLDQSDTIVMRIYGAPHPPAPLRGAVFNVYGRGVWSSTLDRHRHPLSTVKTKKSEDIIDIRNTYRGHDRYFLPYNASDIITADQRGLRTRQGIVFPPAGESPETVSYRVDATALQVLSPPVSDDTAIPSYLRKTVLSRAADWTHGARTPRQRLDRLMSRLARDYTWSDTVPIPRKTDPLNHFLTTGTRGHCAYFASALAMLARGVNLPSRVISGYSVSEYNFLGDYYIVRQRDAHSWVEVWLEDHGWITVDPTPATAVAEQSRTIAHVLDLIPAYWRQTLDFLENVRTTTVMAAVMVLIGTWIAIRRLRRLHRRRPTSFSQLAYQEPPLLFTALLTALEHRWGPRPPHRSLWCYAQQLNAAGDPIAARLLEDYLKWRFGPPASFEPIETRIRHILKNDTPPTEESVQPSASD